MKEGRKLFHAAFNTNREITFHILMPGNSLCNNDMNCGAEARVSNITFNLLPHHQPGMGMPLFLQLARPECYSRSRDLITPMNINSLDNNLSASFARRIQQNNIELKTYVIVWNSQICKTIQSFHQVLLK